MEFSNEHNYEDQKNSSHNADYSDKKKRKSESGQPEPENEHKKIGVVTPETGVIVRRPATLSFLKVAKKGCRVTILDESESFFKCQFEDGKVGLINKSHLSIINP